MLNSLKAYATALTLNGEKIGYRPLKISYANNSNKNGSNFYQQTTNQGWVMHISYSEMSNFRFFLTNKNQGMSNKKFRPATTTLGQKVRYF